ncbi:PepSY-like domain-containing protein [Brachyspira murdochii]|uniref:PepSY-like domain-containing protein n=1 Tax=Brachyspira murdochii TaxID=84378 RepID=UPI0030067465
MNMKKNIIMIIALIFVLQIAAFSQYYGQYDNSISQKTMSFIKSAYPNTQVFKLKSSKEGGYKVTLSNGAKIDFSYYGEWVNVDGKYNGVPENIIPRNILSTIKNTYPQSIVVKIKREWGNYKVKLNNGMELLISENGELFGQRYK